MAQKLVGDSSGYVAEVDAQKNLFTRVPGANASGVDQGGGAENGPAIFSEVDAGVRTGSRFVLAPETDLDYALRVSTGIILDDEVFNYTAQNTGKHQYHNTTMTNSWATGGLTTNSGNITTTTTGTSFRSYAMFPIFGSGVLTYFQAQVGFTQQPNANQVIDFGLFQFPTTNPYAPTDGAYFRVDSSGVKAVVNNNGTETETVLNGTGGTWNFSYTNNTIYRFIIAIHEGGIIFWVNDEIAYKYTTPIGQGTPFLSQALPIGVRHAIVGGAAGSTMSAVVKAIGVSVEGMNFSEPLGARGNGIYGSYQGLSGGTMGSLASYANSTNPTAAVPTNTTSTVLTALGGQGWETDTLAVTTDGIIMSYQVPSGTVSTPGKRLKLTGIKITSFVQTALTGGGYNAQFALAFGHTSVSAATAEAATTKATRRIALGSYSVASGATALTQLPDITLDLSSAPVYVNPGEFIAVLKKKIGTAPSAGVIAYTFTPIYSWE